MSSLEFPGTKPPPRRMILLDNIAQKEMVIGLANYIIGLECDLASLVRVCTGDRLQTHGHCDEVLLRKMANKLAREEGFVHRASEQRQRLRLMIANTTDSCSLVRTLHREFLEDQGSDGAAN